ncbi:MAG: hypothetical protein IJN13_00300 [Bacilli bacterium]|nr:hypothetical protein [Bacilli bacterium]
MNVGYIKLYRKILDNPVVNKDNDYFKLWMYLLLMATHKERKIIFGSNMIVLKKGQLVTGRKRISNDCKISESKVERILKALEVEQQIEQQTASKGRLITIVNWDEYQDGEQFIDQQLNNNWTITKHPVNTNNNINNVNNEINNKNKKFMKPTIDEIKQYCTERNSNIDVYNFYDFYESKDWMVGKNKMKDWKACVRTWERNNTSPKFKTISDKNKETFAKWREKNLND